MNVEEILAGIWAAVNPRIMFAIAGGAILLHRAERITARQAKLWPMYAGAAYGVVAVMAHARDMGGWIRPEVLALMLVESFVINGFAAGFAGRALSSTWNKVMGDDAQQRDVVLPDRNPLTPPAPLTGTRGNAVRNNGDDNMTTEARNEEEQRR